MHEHVTLQSEHCRANLQSIPDNHFGVTDSLFAANKSMRKILSDTVGDIRVRFSSFQSLTRIRFVSSNKNRHKLALDKKPAPTDEIFSLKSS